MPKLVLDTETGGLDAEKVSIMSVGCAVLDDDFNVIDTFEEYVSESEIRFDKRAMEINKIDINWLRKNGKSPDKVVSVLNTFLGKHFDLGVAGDISMIGHNISFDVRFMKRLYRLAGVDYEGVFSHRTTDTASIIRFLNDAKKLPLTSASSDKAFAHFGIIIASEKRHTALGDALGTAELYKKLIELGKGEQKLVKASVKKNESIDKYHKDIQDATAHERNCVNILNRYHDTFSGFKHIDELEISWQDAEGDAFDPEKKQWMEIKVDSYKDTGNLAIERYSNLELKVDGGPWQYAKCKFFVYYYRNQDRILIMRTEQLRELTEKLLAEGKLREFTIQPKETGKACRTFGYLVKEIDIINSGIAYKEIKTKETVNA